MMAGVDGEEDTLGGFVFAAACWAAVFVTAGIDVSRGVRRRVDSARGALRRWPLPPTLGMLTNEQIDEHLRRA